MAASPNYTEETKNHPTTNLEANQKATEELTEAERQILAELRKTYIEGVELEVLQHKSIFEVEVCIDEAYKRLFDERKAILLEFKSGPLKNFWIKVFKTAGILLSETDEQIMQHLIDVRTKMFNKPKVKMVLEFEFEKNPYFKNKVLTKIYYIKCFADPKSAVLYDGIEITSTEGTQIHWLIKRNAFTDDEDRQYSFFDFFANHSDGVNVNRAVLSEEIAFGFFLREKVIPKAIHFFTGDIRVQTLDTTAKDQNSADNDGDSENDSDVEQPQNYVEFENDFNASELADNEREKRERMQSISTDEERLMNELENQPLIDVGDDS